MKMNPTRLMWLVVAGLCLLTVPTLGQSMHSLGFGAHYFRVLGDIKDDGEFAEDGLGYNVSYRLRLGLIAFEGLIQMFPDGWYESDNSYTPTLFVLFGNNVYCGVGVLAHYSEVQDKSGASDTKWSDASYQLRAGLEMSLILDLLTLDLNGNYLFNNWSEVKDFEHDAIEFGAGLRLYL